MRPETTSEASADAKQDGVGAGRRVKRAKPNEAFRFMMVFSSLAILSRVLIE